MTALTHPMMVLAAGAGCVAMLGCVQAVAGTWMVDRFDRRARRATRAASALASSALASSALASSALASSRLPAVTVLKPLHGDEPMLEQALIQFIEQDYPHLQIVFGVQDPADPAIAVVQRLRQLYPGRDLSLVVDPTPHGPNRKIGNLINMLPHAVHDLLVISDSDIHVAPDYLRQVVTTLLQPGVGLVTTLYRGVPASSNLMQRLAACQINHNFMPGVLLSRLLGRQDCLGSTMALQRSTLAAVGGLSMLSGHVADDSVLGRLVRAQGLRIEIAPSLTATTTAETSAAELFAHELRWGRTVRMVEPVGYGLSAVQFPLFWAALAPLLAPASAWTWLLFASVWILRGVAAGRIDRLTGAARVLPSLLLPFRDWLSAVVMAASFTGRRVAWRGQTLHVSGWNAGVAGHAPPILAPVSSTLAAASPAPRPLAPRPILVHAHQTLAQGD
ncbi:bacteriohopanetetrol glucosamine biosynthesis glycosyltransferase HpnI [Lichenicoccus sp.]|uniref:bacteriohopanetetrol glucosamine biosynthesis glycosyltransferase HpnI n=1 Tax=Lichenicoccus sp. TaxID=2781899 RepID=UPI003D123FDD